MPAKHKPTTLHKSMSANKPEPPADMAKRFQASTHFIFDQYLKSRPYDKWTVPDLRQVAQIALLEDVILAAQEEIATNGTTTLGSQGQQVTNPAFGVLIKAQQQQGSMMRRMGIAVKGIDNLKEARKDAEFHLKQDQIDANDKHKLLA